MRKPAKRLQGERDAFAVQFAGRHHVAADRANRLFVVHHGRRARQAFIDDEANRIRADVDDGHRPLRPRVPRANPGPRKSMVAAERETAISVAPHRDGGDGSRLIDLERTAAAGERRVRHENRCARKTHRRPSRGDRVRKRRRASCAALRLILEHGDHDLIEHLLVDGGISRPAPALRRGGRDCAASNRRRKYRPLPSDGRPYPLPKQTSAAMFEETADDAFDANIVRQAGDARPQATDAAYDEFDVDAGLACQIKRIDQFASTRELSFTQIAAG